MDTAALIELRASFQRILELVWDYDLDGATDCALRAKIQVAREIDRAREEAECRIPR